MTTYQKDPEEEVTTVAEPTTEAIVEDDAEMVAQE